MDKCEECFGAANGDCDDCPFSPFIIINASDDNILEEREEK